MDLVGVFRAVAIAAAEAHAAVVIGLVGVDERAVPWIVGVRRREQRVPPLVGQDEAEDVEVRVDGRIVDNIQAVGRRAGSGECGVAAGGVCLDVELHGRAVQLGRNGAGISAVARRPVPLEKVSPHLIRAVIAAEDARFFEHHGVDWDAVKEAREHNRRQAGRRRPRIRGASTITQQLPQNLFLSPERSLLRKGREAAIAMTMDLVLPKSVVLEHYLSAIEWGERVYGCEAAARATFGVPASRLSPSQAATLAAMIPNPVWYRRHPDRLSKRAARIALRVARERPSLEPLEDEDDEEAAFFAR
ncbi:monofunctional biosynthetic peptidoglycan transglycosylase [Acidobacteria bacterium ACD]|nr:monofunctional biosynthetic peptidoglycan transglycosylase [Acidobacteria bacterium ACD]